MNNNPKNKIDYEAPEAQVIKFQSDDVLTASDENQGEWDPQAISWDNI